MSNHPVIVSTAFSIEGFVVREHRGMVRGIVVRTPTIAQGFFGRIKNVIGGQIGAYTKMCEQARVDAFDLMIAEARKMGGNAVIGVRYDAAEVVPKHGATEVLCYGTAVLVERIPLPASVKGSSQKLLDS